MIADDQQTLRRAGQAVTLAMLLAVGIAGSLLPDSGLIKAGSPIGQLGTALVSVSATALAFITPRWLPLLATCGVASLIIGGREALMFVTVYLAALYGRRLLMLCAMSLAVAAATTVDVIGHRQLDPLGWLSTFGIYLLLPAVLGSWQRAHRRLSASLAERAAQAEREQALIEARARAGERARIAEEMHDVVAHQVSLMVLYAGAVGSQLASNGSNPAEPDIANQVDLIRTTGRTTLHQLREVLGVLRRSADDPDGTDTDHSQCGLAELDALIRAARDAKLEVSIRRIGDIDGLPTLVDESAYRVIRESITNVIKHAGPVPTTIELTRDPASLELSVINDPPTSSHVGLPGTGSGLIGLRHRVELLGGTFTSGPLPNRGFEVKATWPLPGSEERSIEIDR